MQVESHATPRSRTTELKSVQPMTVDRRTEGHCRSILGEPLVHFFVAGAIVFGAYWLFDNEPAAAVDRERIEIDANDVRQIAVSWLAQGRLPLTRGQLQSLVDHKVTEEILFREGLALGLDRNDEIIKRRVVQKMDFLAADVAAIQEPAKSELVEWFSKNSDRFALPPRVSFRHLYFSPDKRGNAAHGDAMAALDAVSGKGADSPEVARMADPFVLRSYYSDTTPNLILKEFGPAFAAELFELDPGGWRGPIQSGYGWHLVWIDSMEPGRVPALEEVEANVRSAWRDDRYQEIKRSALDEMRARYTVDVVPLESVDLSDLDGPNLANSGLSETVTP